MHTVILTFPGHFLQTVLCMRSIQEYYPDRVETITVIADDVQCSPWTSYVNDLTEVLGDYHRIQIVPSSTISGVRDCVAGWWRQQLVKLTLDHIMPDDAWFVVDGDVIFRSRCEVQGRVPISRRHDASHRWSQMCVNYVQALLGTDQGIMHDQGHAVITSPVPFRYLDRTLLQALRSHVESRFHGDFVDLHLAWFRDQTIVADIDPPTRWVMSEWELIECFRQMVQKQRLPYQDIGSGYQIDVDTATLAPGAAVFLHSYLRDSMIGCQWFEDQGITVPDSIWQKSLSWYDARERQRLT